MTATTPGSISDSQLEFRRTALPFSTRGSWLVRQRHPAFGIDLSAVVAALQELEDRRLDFGSVAEAPNELPEPVLVEFATGTGSTLAVPAQTASGQPAGRRCGSLVIRAAGHRLSWRRSLYFLMIFTSRWA
jgi:hypothetical protein